MNTSNVLACMESEYSHALHRLQTMKVAKRFGRHNAGDFMFWARQQKSTALKEKRHWFKFIRLFKSSSDIELDKLEDSTPYDPMLRMTVSRFQEAELILMAPGHGFEFAG